MLGVVVLRVAGGNELAVDMQLADQRTAAELGQRVLRSIFPPTLSLSGKRSRQKPRMIDSSGDSQLRKCSVPASQSDEGP